MTSLRGMKADYLPNNARPEGEEGRGMEKGVELETSGGCGLVR